MQNRDDFEANFHQQPEVVKFVDEIIKQYKLPIQTGDEEYIKFCLQALEMLYRLDKKKAQYKNQMLHGDQPVTMVSAVIGAKDNNLPKLTIRQLIDKFTDHKIDIEKTWYIRTEKGYRENLDRISDIFDYAAKKKTPVSEMMKEHSREVRKILLIIPTNMRKKFPELTFRQIISKCQKGEIARLESERMSPNTINTYAGLIKGLCDYALDEDYVKTNHFTNLRERKQVRKVRSAFTNDELNKFFNSLIVVMWLTVTTPKFYFDVDT